MKCFNLISESILFELFQIMKTYNINSWSKQLNIDDIKLFLFETFNINLENGNEQLIKIWQRLNLNYEGIWSFVNFKEIMLKYLNYEKYGLNKIIYSSINYESKKYIITLNIFLLLIDDENISYNFNEQIKNNLWNWKIFKTNQLLNTKVNYIFLYNKFNEILNDIKIMDSYKFYNKFRSNLKDTSKKFFIYSELEKLQDVLNLINYRNLDEFIIFLLKHIENNKNTDDQNIEEMIYEIIYYYLNLVKRLFNNKQNVEFNTIIQPIINQLFICSVDNKFLFKILTLLNKMFIFEKIKYVDFLNSFEKLENLNILVWMKFLNSFTSKDFSDFGNYDNQFINKIFVYIDSTINNADIKTIIQYIIFLRKNYGTNSINKNELKIVWLNKINNVENFKLNICIFEFFLKISLIDPLFFDTELINFLTNRIILLLFEESIIILNIFINLINSNDNNILNIFNNSDNLNNINNFLKRNIFYELNYLVILIIKELLMKNILLLDTLINAGIINQLRKNLYIFRYSNNILEDVYNIKQQNYYDIRGNILSLEIFNNILENYYNKKISFPLFFFEDIFINTIHKMLLDYIDEKDKINFLKILSSDFIKYNDLNFYSITQQIFQVMKEYTFIENKIVNFEKIWKFQNMLCLTNNYSEKINNNSDQYFVYFIISKEIYDNYKITKNLNFALDFELEKLNLEFIRNIIHEKLSFLRNIEIGYINLKNKFVLIDNYKEFINITKISKLKKGNKNCIEIYVYEKEIDNYEEEVVLICDNCSKSYLKIVNDINKDSSINICEECFKLLNY